MKKPEWVPENAGNEYTTNVMAGVQSRHDGISNHNLGGTNIAKPKIKKLSVDDYVKGVAGSKLTVISKAITLVESNSNKHMEIAQELIKKILPNTGKSIRIGITGSPGAGKSTFIESFGTYLCQQGHKVAVLAVDPSSTLTKGSILGDKTRMEKLARNDMAFIRPSPSGGTLGGVARKTRETLLVCEAAGYDVIIVETVGIGQSETTVRSMVDFFLLVLLPGAGDELQGIKKGSVEIADALVINKADGDNVNRAELTASQYRNALHYILPSTEGWITQVKTCSALNSVGVDDIWFMINEYITFIKDSGLFESRRRNQMLNWVYSMVEETLLHNFYNNEKIKDLIKDLEPKISNGYITPTNAVNMLLSRYFDNISV